MTNEDSFVPQQAMRKDVDLYAEITANSTRDVARQILQMVPPLSAQARIHDMGCGAGEVTSAIMEAAPPAGIAIDATDIDQSYLDRLQARARQHAWPVCTANMSGEQLRFDDGVFDLIVANFVVFLTPGDGIPAVREMRRTLCRRGTAVFTSWARLPHVDPVKAAHSATRPANGPRLREIPAEWWLGSHLQAVAVAAGFDAAQTQLHRVKVHVTVHDEQHLARVLWSYLGPPTTGWLPSDEDNWDKAMAVILRSFRETDGFECDDAEGTMRITLTANVLLARK